MRAPVSACLIVRNEEAQLEACLQSIREHVQELIVVDTGSTDKTPEIAKKYADKFAVFTDCNDEEGRIKNFAQAREYSFSLASLKWLMWVDGDDEVTGAEKIVHLIEQAEKGLKPSDPAVIMFPYEYSRDQQTGISTCRHYRERLIRNWEYFKWTNPVHEVVVSKVPMSYQEIRTDDVVIVHHRENKPPNEKGRNLRILQQWYKEHGDADVRQLYYLGTEYGNEGMPDEAIKFFKLYVEKAGWEDEKCLATLKLAEHYRWKNDYEEQLAWGFKSLLIKENWSECYFTISRAYYFIAQQEEAKGINNHGARHWEKSVYFARQGLALPPTRTILFVNQLERDIDIHRYLNYALFKIGEYRNALDSVDLALKLAPNDGELLFNKKHYERMMVKDEVDKAISRLVALGEFTDQKKKSVIDFIDSKDGSPAIGQVPGALIAELWGLITKYSPGLLQPFGSDVSVQEPTLTPTPEAATSTAVTVPVPEASVTVPAPEPVVELIHAPMNVAFYVGPTVEPWNPVIARDKGIGGSETAVIEMGKELFKRGHKITVYGDCRTPGLEGSFDGVQYLDHSKYQNIACDVLVTSRKPHAVDASFNTQRKATFCWIHDVHLGGDLTHERSLHIDKFLCLSNWHKGNVLAYHNFLHPDHVIVTRNGIDLNRFNKKLERDAHRAVYSSSPDRGMQVACTIWPRVREQVPDAELHVYYGFETWEKFASGDDGQQNLIKYLKQMLKNYEHAGVFFHGRVDQQKLADEFLTSGVWCYPTWFSETSCITCMEAHAAGLHMVTSPIAALNETAGSRASLVHGDWLSLDYQNRFIDAVVAAMKKPEDGSREELQRYAKENFSWSSVASDWEKMFSNVIQEVQLDIMPPFKSTV